jgi:hypothetical protein
MGRFVYKPCIDDAVSQTKTQNGELFTTISGEMYFRTRDGAVRKLSTSLIADISNLQQTLDGKATTSHKHAMNDITGLDVALSGKISLSAINSASGVAGLDATGKLPSNLIPEDISASSAKTVNVTNWSSGAWSAPTGWSLQKEYSGTSIKITHNEGKYPSGWFALNKATTPMSGVVPSATRNIQVEDLNTVIITQIGVSEVFDITLTF